MLETDVRQEVPIGFVLLSNSKDPQPSTRISVLNMFPFLRRAGFDPRIVFEPETGHPEPELDDVLERVKSLGIRIVYFQKVHGAGVLKVVEALSRSGVRTVYGVCDFVDNEMARRCDVTIAVTDFLKALYEPDLQWKISVVHDGIEHPDRSTLAFHGERGTRQNPIRAVLVTSSSLTHLPAVGRLPEGVELTIVGRYPAESDRIGRINWTRWSMASIQTASAKLAFVRFVCNSHIRRIQWSEEEAYAQMSAADIAIIPVDRVDDPVPGASVSWWEVKSENRLTMKMSMALPVVASPVPSYLGVVEQGRNGFIADTAQQWHDCLELLRNPEVRRRIGLEARNSVAQRFSQAEQARKLIGVLKALL
jgi:glycosyltransferase involved in cell wall biosynthesis